VWALLRPPANSLADRRHHDVYEPHSSAFNSLASEEQQCGQGPAVRASSTYPLPPLALLPLALLQLALPPLALPSASFTPRSATRSILCRCSLQGSIGIRTICARSTVARSTVASSTPSCMLHMPSCMLRHRTPSHASVTLSCASTSHAACCA